MLELGVADQLRQCPRLVRIRWVEPRSAQLQFTRWVAPADIDLGGYRIAAGRHIVAWIDAANRDPARFADPDTFDIRRTDNRHLACNGINACLGGSLARLQAAITFAALTQRLPNSAWKPTLPLPGRVPVAAEAAGPHQPLTRCLPPDHGQARPRAHRDDAALCPHC